MSLCRYVVMLVSRNLLLQEFLSSSMHGIDLVWAQSSLGCIGGDETARALSFFEPSKSIVQSNARYFLQHLAINWVLRRVERCCLGRTKQSHAWEAALGEFLRAFSSRLDVLVADHEHARERSCLNLMGLHVRSAVKSICAGVYDHPADVELSVKTVHGDLHLLEVLHLGTAAAQGAQETGHQPDEVSHAAKARLLDLLKVFDHFGFRFNRIHHSSLGSS